MASAPPDSHPDSNPDGPSTDVEQVSPARSSRESVEDPTPGNPDETAAPPDDAGLPGGTAGTGGTNHRQDRDITS